jgi:hypothetical protein
MALAHRPVTGFSNWWASPADTWKALNGLQHDRDVTSSFFKAAKATGRNIQQSKTREHLSVV